MDPERVRQAVSPNGTRLRDRVNVEGACSITVCGGVSNRGLFYLILKLF